MKSNLIKAAPVVASVVFMAMALFSPLPLWAQEARGIITGKVTDTGKGAIPGASIRITNVAMGTTVSLMTNDAGLFQAPYLIPGTYQVVVETAGFKKHVRDGVVLRVNDTIEIDVELEVGGVQDTVTITADAPQLDTTTASMGQVVDERRIAELPIPHGEPYALIGLAGGVAFTRDQRLDRPFEPTHIVGYSIDGTRANRSDVTIDGAPATARANANEVISSYVPPADIVAEFKVQTATFDASFGQTEGGVTNLSLKSGTNALHGTAYYTKMAPGIFANDFFANANNIPRPDFNYNRWGGVLSGPVVLPKLYNGRNRTFFMWGYEGIHEARPRNNGTPTVPTEKMKGGDFSELLALGPQYQIYNPYTRRALGGGRYQQDPFSGNIIPAQLINPVARRVVDTYFPKPLTAGNPDGTGNFQNPSLKEQITYYTHTIKIDHVVSDRQRLSVRGSWYPRESNYNNYFGNIATGEWFQFFSRAGTVDDVYTFNATTVLNVRYGYNRFIRVTDSNPGNRGMDLTMLGLPSYYSNLIPKDIRRFPRFDITGYQGTGIGGEFRPNDTHTVGANYTFSKYMEATELLNQDDPRPTKVISDQDRPHRLSVSGIFELPFGQGRLLLPGVNSVVLKIISGWQVSGIYAYQSGPPLSWGNIIFTGNLKDIQLPAGQRTVEHWFNTDAGFERNAARQLGSNVRTFPLRFGFLRADSINNYDLSVLKNTKVAEGKNVQFRADFINAFNHPLFPAPNTNVTQASFGRINPSTQANYSRRIQLTLKFLF